ncbi:hypothetical protein J7I98_32030 [Streptomyces sp. ISL-98]|uniref:hypothetical protein n=1 Tax=Streptomyces sp. ISL-98 TaxID=2819192 RepID=UPI001BEA676E|nr:hypothetical protein [Streptomyces sp. ISL-98]MBT2510401.1 hypothetical protein [Streptomyces sp. ISL-98]
MRPVVADRRRVPFGPVLRSRREWLEDQGLITPGEEKEELVIIRAERSGSRRRAFLRRALEADAVHEQVVRRDIVGGLLEEEPWPDAEADAAFGVDATGRVDALLGERLVAAWCDGRCSLRAPL